MKVYEITDFKTTMPVDGTGEYPSEQSAIAAVERLKLNEKGIRYIITWYTK